MQLDPKMMRMYAVVTSAALTKVTLIFLGYWIGNKIDKAFGTSPLFMLLSVSLALGLGIYVLVKMIEKKGF